MLYFIKSQNYLKVGYSQDFETLVDRMESYNTHNPEFTLISFTEFGKKTDEKAIHKLLKQYQHYTEWFHEDLEIYKIWEEYVSKKNLIPKNCYFQLPNDIDKLRKLDYKQVWDSTPLPEINSQEELSKEDVEIELLKYFRTNTTFTSDDYIRACKFFEKETGIKITKDLMESYGYIFNEYTDELVTIFKYKYINLSIK